MTHRLLFICHQLGMYQAELARVLHLRCEDIGRLNSGRWDLDPGSEAWRQAERLVHFYTLLEAYLAGDEVAIYRWLRVRHAGLAEQPLLLMVDHDRLEDLISLLEAGHGVVV